MTDTITYCTQLLYRRERCSSAILQFSLLWMCSVFNKHNSISSPEVLLNQTSTEQLVLLGMNSTPGVKGLIVVALIAFQEQQFDILLTSHLVLCGE